MTSKGKVYLVGAGLGNVAYLTVRALQLLTQAEVLVYDALVDDQLLQLVPQNCLKLDVGKRGGKPSTPQAEINQLLVKYCQLGKQIVRLKSGDPFIFGRSAAEIDALIAPNCPFEVIPGISSALAAPLLAGIPLTDPTLSSCFAVFTAHEPEKLDWEALARLETLAILMGGKQLSAIVQQLLHYRRSPQTPVAIIKWAGTPKQQIWTSDLANIQIVTAGVSLSPVIIIVGEVVTLRERLNAKIEIKFPALDMLPDQLPLRGKTILITRSAGQSSQFSDRLATLGANVIEMPALEIGPPVSWEDLDRAIAHIADFDWLVLTSTNGVDYFFTRLATQGKDARVLAGVKIAVVGEKTAHSLEQHGLHPDFIPPSFIADALVEHFPEALLGKKVLFPRVETGGREVLVKEFTAKGADVVEVAAYESRCPQTISPDALKALQQQVVDVITFASSKTVKNFCQLLASHGGANLDSICIASIGPLTSKACQQQFGRVDIEAEEYTLEGLAQAIVQWPKH
ncbi:uroporphyrinogen-III C-methyltransferase [Gloeocapsopsis dulcis]|uniref:uroporphyrinogen-III C-methyltransferase n=1 Tax=Gloeocapsopsis dulcis AAB1 = 1H9 TaxID=1433147 RepID=A0A6N8FRE4_9CHRO|nr:uroporphyrinogen-III C-methyltransferase [Gloeocapsopsis dulcis]MUL35683.1 uroporphyrinogen-III C-methyltransferase [Gloeocapsopsis dulcis AAB1 = 1H9]WNN91035.1 uroporphyrinogen-III C-methyltransferase [Gloeocapsopsis dulcis]